ncbi:MAG: tol-pal system protein YbgF [Gammaproteobacteria bacterium]|nr:tol-pal system protein YbgF [Gammaproteobacteria bacterium]
MLGGANTVPNVTINDELLTRLRALEEQLQALQGRVDELQHSLKQNQSEQAQQFLIFNKKLAELPRPSPAPVQTSAPVKNASATVAAPKKTADSSVILAPDAQEKATYDAAYGLVSAKAYSDAIEAFQGYLSIYPSGKYTPNAYYWLAELQAKPTSYPSALKNLQIIVDNYPQSPKAPDALLKLGMISQRMGDPAKAKQWFERLIKEYPDSKSAKSAKQYMSA